MRSSKIKKALFLSLSVVTFLTLNGCSDSKKESSKSVNKETQAPKIEIVENSNAHEVKVNIKESDKTQSKSYYLNYDIKSEYDAKSQPANKDASVRVRPRTTIDANMNIRSPYEKVQVSLLVKTLSKEFIVRCSACHNDYANGIIGPSLLKRDDEYIYNKIADFKSGKKSNPFMNDLIKMMSDDEIRKMAKEIYRFNKEIKNMREKK